jgi:gluconate 2-dehydrogenase gamma chain
MRSKKDSIQRRRFLGAGLSATATGVLASCGRSGGGPHWRFFTAAEASAVDAICEQLIPADTDPGARQAGVVNFIDLQLTKHHKRHQGAYRKGIAGVDAVSRKRFGKPFAELPAEQQIEVLTEVEEKDAEFFGLIRTHAMQGFYGDPRHGGNRGAVSWKMLGLSSPPVRGRMPAGQKAG